MEDSSIQEDEVVGSNLAQQAMWVVIHSLMAIGSWIVMMIIISLFNPSNVPVMVTLAASFVVPFLVGNIFTRVQQNEMAPYTWLIGLIWFLVICLWILDMPTGPNQCYHCDASQKIFLTFFSPSEDSGLVDGQGRAIGTWPATAFLAYGIGSSFALKRKSA